MSRSGFQRNLKRFTLCTKSSAVGYPGFLERGWATIPKGDRQPITWPNFPENWKMKKIGLRGHPKFYYVGHILCTCFTFILCVLFRYYLRPSNWPYFLGLISTRDFCRENRTNVFFIFFLKFARPTTLTVEYESVVVSLQTLSFCRYVSAFYTEHCEVNFKSSWLMTG